MDVAVANWLVGTFLLTCAVIKVNWGAELVVYAHLNYALSWRLLGVGELWFGWFHLMAGVSLYGWLGWLLLDRSGNSVPSVFAVAAAVFTIDAIMSWYFLGNGQGGDT